ncbi:SoxY-related AACIE arm protein [Polaromonas sp.]|uniref:SoxY-related AACIE arm protein n=1 Tax=Polaromonas sp. TaxID=1869339 RepID=UPI00375366DA
MPTLTRRRVLGGVAALSVGVRMGPAAASTDALAAAVASYAGGAPVRPGKVRLDIAELVDNGNVVPLTVTVDSPMTAGDHVRAIAIFNEKNPQRDVAKFTLGLRAGKASVSTRIRLATSQQLVAVAQLSDGSFWSHTVNVIVTLAACIEGDP